MTVRLYDHALSTFHTCGIPGEALVKALDPVMQRVVIKSKWDKALSKFKLVKLVYNTI